VPRKDFSADLRLTPGDRAVLAFVVAFGKCCGRGPTLTEIAREFGWTAHGTAQRHVNALLARKELVRDPIQGLRSPAVPMGAVCLARVVKAEDKWVTAPEPNLVAWVHESQTIFADPTATPKPGDPLLVKEANDNIFYTRAGTSNPKRFFSKRDGTGMTLLGVVRFVVQQVAPE